MASSDTKASFLTLPPELRIKIYRYALPDARHTEPKYRLNKRDADVWFPGHILFVNKTFSVEVAPLVYSAPTFVFDSLCDAVTFLRKIGKVNCSYITELSFGRFWLTRNEAAYLDIEYDEAWERVTDEIIRCLPNLTSLTLFGAAKEGPKSRWNVKALENYQSLMNKLPGLPFVYWRSARLWLSSTANTGNKLANMQVFDVDELLQSTKDEIKAAESAGARQAAATRRARKAQAAS